MQAEPDPQEPVGPARGGYPGPDQGLDQMKSVRGLLAHGGVWKHEMREKGSRPPRPRSQPAIIPVVSSWFETYGYASILDELVIGAYPLDAADVGQLQGLGIQRVLNLVQEREYRAGEREAVEAAYAAAGIEEHRLDFTDFGDLPAKGIDIAVAQILGWLTEDWRTYLHCRAGWQRSAAVAAGVVAVRENLEIEDALAFVQARKPTADPLPHQVSDLRRWWHARRRPDA